MFSKECFNLFLLYFKFLEEVFIDLKIISKIKILFHDGKKFTKLILDDNNHFDLLPLKSSVLDIININPNRDLYPSGIHIDFEDSDDFIKFLNVKPDLRFKLS